MVKATAKTIKTIPPARLMEGIRRLQERPSNNCVLVENILTQIGYELPKAWDARLRLNEALGLKLKNELKMPPTQLCTVGRYSEWIIKPKEVKTWLK